MKCEIIDSKLILEPSTPTELWAVNVWLEDIACYHRVPDKVEVKSCTDLQNAPTPEQAAAVKADEDAELDAIFGKIE